MRYNNKIGRKTGKIITYILCSTLFTIAFGCNGDGYSTKFGSPISNRKVIPIAALFVDTAAYEGKTVTVQGVIDMQDQKGYWFYLQDEDARIYVETYNADFSIPDLTKKKILVEGVIEVNLKIPSLLARGVEHQQ